MLANGFSAITVWDDYATLQTNAERRRRIDHKSWASDEQMDSFLDLLSIRDGLDPSHPTGKRLNNLVTNRAKKYRRRNQLLCEYCVSCCRSHVKCAKLDSLCNGETFSQVRHRVTEVEWSTFQELAEGDDYATIAARQHLTVSALKSRISRCRYRLGRGGSGGPA